MRLPTSISPGDGEIALSVLRGVRAILRGGVTPAFVVIALLAVVSPAQASEASTIIEKCVKGKPFGGYSQRAYREALKQLTTESLEYTPCENQIRKDELAAAGGGAGTAGGGESAPNVALPLTPAEQHSVQNAKRAGSASVQVGSEPIHPGVVHADIASAVNTLPHSLFAMLAFLFGACLTLVGGEVAKRVRARRNG